MRCHLTELWQMQTHCRKNAVKVTEYRWYICMIGYCLYLISQLQHAGVPFHKQVASDYTGLWLAYKFTKCNSMISRCFLSEIRDIILLITDQWRINLTNSTFPMSLPPGLKAAFSILHMAAIPELVGVSLASQTCFSCLCPSISRRQLKTSLEN